MIPGISGLFLFHDDDESFFADPCIAKRSRREREWDMTCSGKYLNATSDVLYLAQVAQM
jgi:hypothetical protein